MLKSLFPWKHNKTKAMAAQPPRPVQQTTMDDATNTPDLTLYPCRVCSRTFLLKPLKKHERICEKTAVKKRKPFDSLKQRVTGTDLAQFHQKSYLKKHDTPSHATPDPKRKRRSNWKETHQALVDTIRAAKGVPTSQGQSVNNLKTKSSSSLMANTERCPSCDRQFGPKAYDRHVEWCKDKKAKERIKNSPADVLLAKGRLEARTRYVPPLYKPKKTQVREKYSGNASSTETLSPLSRGPSVRKPKSLMSVRSRKNVDSELDLEEKRGNMKMDRGAGDKLKKESSVERFNPSLSSALPKSDSVKSTPTYDPFESAQRQFMELLQCDDFASLTKSPIQNSPRPNTTSNATPANKTTPVAQNKTSISATASKTSDTPAKSDRASVIDPPSFFKDSLESVDDFELMEHIINDHFTGDDKDDSDGFYLHLKPLSQALDDSLTIDPSLINEHDNLSLPEHWKIENYSPVGSSTTDTDTTLIQNDVDPFSEQYDRKISSTEPKNDKKAKSFTSPTNSIIKRSTSLINRGKRDVDNDNNQRLTANKLTAKSRLTSSSVSSVSTSKLKTSEKKKGPTLKRPTNLTETVPKPPAMKNKNDVNNYFLQQDQVRTNTESEKELDEFLIDQLKPEDLFTVDDDMYEEYKKYEEMYLKEKARTSETKKTKVKPAELNYGIHTASEEEEQSLQVNKMCNDSAYGSLTRKVPKHRTRATKLSTLEQKQTDSTSSSGSEQCPPSPAVELPINPRQSKFCHECGNRYPVHTAKFCVECGVKRLVL